MAAVERPADWRVVDALLHLPNERTSLHATVVSADQRNSFRITEDVEPCEAYEMEARLEELDQGYRECHARPARTDATAAEAADWLAAKLDV